MDLEYNNGIWDTITTLDTGTPDAIGVIFIVVIMMVLFLCVVLPGK